MKNLIIIAVCLLTLSIASCSKSNSSSSSNNNSNGTTLNSVENQLVGTWYEVSSRDSAYNKDTTYTGYNSSYYIQFSSQGGQFGGHNLLSCTWTFTPTAPANSGYATSSYWYYDNSTKYLVFNSIQFNIKLLTTNQLVLRFYDGMGANIYTFKK